MGDTHSRCLLIKLPGTALCGVGHPTGRRRNRLGVVQREATVVVACVNGIQPHVVSCLLWIGIRFAICFLLCSSWLESICVGEMLLLRREAEKGKPKSDNWASPCTVRVRGMCVFGVLATLWRVLNCYQEWEFVECIDGVDVGVLVFVTMHHI